MNTENNEQRQREDVVTNTESEYSNTRKDPDEWTTGNEPMTGAQHSYLKTLSSEAGEEMDEGLTKAEASKRIEELQRKTGRGLEQANDSSETESERANKNENKGLRGGQSSV